ncbi:HlyD family type I secretion periplasmic adaptor subunit [Glaciecola siphonariae]|uniref:Membrane fusion protein (MFP) family protein n=1 Tax=Glaciecola siphonariae TaxID=521012 RepID=A0ABV9LST2_9ALTE
MDNSFINRAFPDTSRDRTLMLTLISLAVFIALLGVWSSFATVPEVAKTRGEVLPQGGDVQLVQSLSGGKILRVLVAEGDLVSAGDPIAELDQSVSEADIRQLDVEHADLTMRIERLRALEQERNPDFGAEGSQFPGMAREQQDLYASQLAFMRSQLSVIEDQKVSKQASLATTLNQITFIQNQLDAVQKEVDLFTEAASKGLTSQREFLEKQEALASLQKDSEQLTGQAKVLQNELATIDEQQRSKKLELKTQYRTERSELALKLRELEEELIQAHASLGQNALIAPSDGIIKALPNAQVGSVLQPGGVVAELVPSDQPLNVEVRVSPKDIGFISVGQSVLIKVDAYDYSRFGAIEGAVVRVSPATFNDDRTGQPYFKAIIKPNTEFVGNKDKGRRIRVGMTTEADITTGQKTIFQYLLKPVYTTVDTALSER